MDIKVRYFASLRDRMGRSEDQVSVDGGKVTVADVWNKLSSQPIRDHTGRRQHGIHRCQS